MKYIKHLISFLLIFGLTCSIYSSVQSDAYYQVSSVNPRKEISHKHTKVYVYTRKMLSKKVSVSLITFRNLRDIYSTQTQTILKLRILLYQKIDSKIAQTAFLNQRNTSSNIYSSLYLA